MNKSLLKLSLALCLTAGTSFMPERVSAQAACNSTGETVGPAAEFGNSTYAIGDLTVVSGGADPTDVNDADWYLAAGANVDVYAALNIPSGTVVRLKAGAVLNVYGNLTNNGYLFIEPGATINFYGSTWTNSSTAVTGDGIATANTAPGGNINFIAPRPTIAASVSATACVMSNYSGGNLMQSIDGGNVPMDIALHVQNANNIKLINTNTRLEGSVTFDVADGDIDLGNNNFTLTANGTWTTNVAPDAAYFLTNGSSACAGAVEKLGLSPAASFVFPIGRAETYSGGRDFTPATLRNDGAVTDNFQVRVKNYADAISTGGISLNAPLEGIDRAWQITSTNGSGVTMNLQHNAATNGSTYTVFGGDASAFISQYLGSGSWDVGTLGTNTSGSTGGSVVHSRGLSLTTTATNCSDPGSWFTKTPDFLTPLPITLASFTAVADGCNAVLSWHTAAEQSFSRYDIEYSTDATTFSRIGSVASHQSSTGSSYSYTHGQDNGRGYYRLRLVTVAGQSSLSNVINVYTTCGAARNITAWPNPTNSLVHISGLNAGEEVQVYNVAGQQISRQTATSAAGQVDLSPYASGLYQVIVVNGQERQAVIKVVKE